MELWRQKYILTGFDGESSSNTVTGETFQTHANQFLTDSKKEVIKLLPNRLLHLCLSTPQSFTAGTPDTLNTGKILFVTRTNSNIEYPCRKIQPFQKGRYDETGDMNKPTVTDPVWWIENNTIDVLPTNLLLNIMKFNILQYNMMIQIFINFPDEAVEKTVVLGSCIKVEYLMSHEEDIELLVPILNQLEKDYQKELSGLV